MPCGFPETRRSIGAGATLRQGRQPCVMRAGNIDKGGDTAAHQVAQHHRQGGFDRAVADLDQVGIFIESIAPQCRGALIFEHPLGDRLLSGMAVHIDEAGQHHPVLAGYFVGENTIVAAAHLDEAIGVIGDVAIREIAMALPAFIIADDRGDVADDMNIVSHG